jgi:hypothetical protein
MHHPRAPDRHNGGMAEPSYETPTFPLFDDTVSSGHGTAAADATRPPWRRHDARRSPTGTRPGPAGVTAADGVAVGSDGARTTGTAVIDSPVIDAQASDPAGDDPAGGGPAGDGPGGHGLAGTVLADPEVEIRVSRRRKKSAVAFWEKGRIIVVLPAHVSGAKRDELVAWLVERTRSRRPGSGASDDVLARRAAELADRYVDGVRPSAVRWVTNQHKRWGSCTQDTGEIRLSHRLQGVPGWVLDAVLVHELTHLVHPDHSSQFHEVANRFPRQDEASVFLDGFSHGLEHR